MLPVPASCSPFNLHTSSPRRGRKRLELQLGRGCQHQGHPEFASLMSIWWGWEVLQVPLRRADVTWLVTVSAS